MKTIAEQFIHGLSRDELAAACAELGEPGYRADQIWRWLYRQWVADWAEMKNLPTALQTRLAETFTLPAVRERHATGKIGSTRKLLVALADGECVEEVLIPTAKRRTVCVSSQVGCKFGCVFCASGQGGIVRSLRAGEIVAQVVAAARADGAAPTHVVYMGIGEPFDNYDEVLKSARILNDSAGLNIGSRRITISTVGVVPGIRRMAGEGTQFELSVSLHAPNQDLRAELMPVARKYGLDELFDACRDYASATGRIITFEYTLIAGVNDSVMHARELVRRLRPLPSRVNLLPLNPVAEYAGQTPSLASVEGFSRVLNRAGVNATIRSTRGAGMAAACGQLRRQRTAAEALP